MNSFDFTVFGAIYHLFVMLSKMPGALLVPVAKCTSDTAPIQSPFAGTSLCQLRINQEYHTLGAQDPIYKGLEPLNHEVLGS